MISKESFQFSEGSSFKYRKRCCLTPVTAPVVRGYILMQFNTCQKRRYVIFPLNWCYYVVKNGGAMISRLYMNSECAYRSAIYAWPTSVRYGQRTGNSFNGFEHRRRRAMSPPRAKLMGSTMRDCDCFRLRAGGKAFLDLISKTKFTMILIKRWYKRHSILLWGEWILIR